MPKRSLEADEPLLTTIALASLKTTQLEPLLSNTLLSCLACKKKTLSTARTEIQLFNLECTLLLYIPSTWQQTTDAPRAIRK